MSQKETKAKSEAQEDSHTNLPAYSATPSQEPTAESPFNFPSGPPPAFTSIPTTSSSSSTPTPIAFPRPIAIPQITPDKSAPFLDAYAQPLLQYGITPESWRAFLTTMSAFLAAKVSQQALAHAADMGRHVTNVPKRFGQGTVEHSKSVGQNIRDNAKSGNYLGAAMGVVGGAISLPIGTAFRAVGSVLSLPGAAIGAVTHKPQTPRERATAYAAAANKKWLGMRGLQAQLVDTEELARIVDLPVASLIGLAGESVDRSAASQIHALKEHINELETFTGSKLTLGSNTVWLMVLQTGGTVAATEVQRDSKR